MKWFKDIHDRRIRLTGERQEHIEADHPEMYGQIDKIQYTLMNPDIVIRIKNELGCRAVLSALSYHTRYRKIFMQCLKVLGLRIFWGAMPLSMPIAITIAIVASLAAYVPYAAAVARHVYPGESIQTAMDAATSGDEVIVHKGTYIERINFQGKAITVRSTDPNNPAIVAQTIIDGSKAGSVVTFDHGEEDSSVLSGFTIQNGQSLYGGGVCCPNVSPTIRQCTITWNSASGGYGGGIYCPPLAVNIINCTITANVASRGGGIYCSSWANIIDCTISGNYAFMYGGGIYCAWWCASSGITRCIITQNGSSSYGGGIYCSQSSPNITDCTISKNSADDRGGGIYGSGMSANITNCTITENSVWRYGYDGGGICCEDSFSPKITSCLIAKNYAPDYGGGISCHNFSSPSIINCIIVENSARAGGGISCYYQSSPGIINCTISKNSASRGGGIFSKEEGSIPVVVNCILWNDSPKEIGSVVSHVAVISSDVQGGYSGGNIDADPLFVDPGAGDYHLLSGSPCIDTGTSGYRQGTSVYDAPSFDIEGNARPLGTGYDMGDYEFNAQPTLIELDHFNAVPLSSQASQPLKPPQTLQPPQTPQPSQIPQPPLPPPPPQTGQILITWSTLSEIDTAGFYLCRSEGESGEYIRINPLIIEAAGDATMRAEYCYTDNTARQGVMYSYKLEDIDTRGRSTFHFPMQFPMKMDGMWLFSD